MGAMRPWSHRSRRSGGVHSGAQDRRMNDPPTGASLSRVVRVSIKRPGLTIGVCLTLALAGLVVTARHLTFQTSRSEEHTSELQSQSNLVCRLLLEKKKQITCHEQALMI